MGCMIHLHKESAFVQLRDCYLFIIVFLKIFSHFEKISIRVWRPSSTTLIFIHLRWWKHVECLFVRKFVVHATFVQILTYISQWCCTTIIVAFLLLVLRRHFFTDLLNFLPFMPPNITPHKRSTSFESALPENHPYKPWFYLVQHFTKHP